MAALSGWFALSTQPTIGHPPFVGCLGVSVPRLPGGSPLTSEQPRILPGPHVDHGKLFVTA